MPVQVESHLRGFGALILCTMGLCGMFLLYPHHKMWRGLYWIRFVASVGQSVGRSVGPSPILVRSITPLLMEGFSSNLNDTFTSTRGCAESMLPMCQVKVKATVKGQIFNKQYYTLCRVRSITPLRIEGFPSNLNDTFTSTRGCARLAHVSAQGQGHS